MGCLTTHVLDIAQGRPGSDLAVELYAIDGEHRCHLKSFRTNSDGRCDSPLLEGEEFVAGVYELVFHAAEYFRSSGVEFPELAFLDQIVVRFGVCAANEHYHVPLLVSPYAYSTYRGS